MRVPLGRSVLLALLMILPPTGPLGLQAAERCRFEYALRARGSEVGRILLEQERLGSGRARVVLVIENVGFTRLFGRRRMEMRGIVRLRPEIRPLVYEGREDKPDRRRRITMRFDEDGRLVRFRYLNNGRERPSDVPPELQAGALDPLTAFVQLQRWVEGEPGAGSQLRIPVWDGRKRLDIEAVYLAGARLDGRALYARLRVRLHGLYGFEDGYGFVGGTAGPARWLEVLVDNGQCPAPVFVRPVDGEEPAILRRRSVRQPRRRRSPSPAGAAAARRSRTSRGRCRSRPRARP